MTIDYKKLYEQQLKKTQKLKGRVEELEKRETAQIKNIGKGNPFNYKFSKKLANTMIKQKLVSFTKRTATIKFGIYKGLKLKMDAGEFISELKDAFNRSRELDTNTLKWMKLYIESKKIRSGFYGNDWWDKVGDTARRDNEQIVEEFEMTDNKLNNISKAKKNRFMKYVEAGKYDIADDYAEKIVGAVSKRNNRSLIEMVFRKWN